MKKHNKKPTIFLSSLALVLLVTASASAQEAPLEGAPVESAPSATLTVKSTVFGVSAGFNSSTITSPGISDLDVSLNRRMGLTGGVFMLRRISDRVGLQIAAGISDKGVSIDAGTAKATIELRYLELPVLLRYELAPRASSVRPYVSAGVSLSFLLSAKLSGEEDAIDIKSQSEEMEASGSAAIGFAIPQGKGALTFEARYNHGLTHAIHGQVGQQEEKVKNRAASVLIGYLF